MPPIYGGFFVIIICFQCKYKATILIMQTRNSYAIIRKIYTTANLFIVLTE